MTEYFDFVLAPFRHFLGPVYDSYRKKYSYTETETVPGYSVGTIEGVPLPDVVGDRKNKFYYSVYGPPDDTVKAGIVGEDVQIKMQGKPIVRTYPRGEKTRPVEWLPENVEMHETFVDMPFTQKTKFRTSTVATRHG